MNVVFDGLIGFGVKFRVFLVENFCDLVKFGESYRGLDVGVMEVLERSLKDERCFGVGMGKKKIFFF